MIRGGDGKLFSFGDGRCSCTFRIDCRFEVGLALTGESVFDSSGGVADCFSGAASSGDPFRCSAGDGLGEDGSNPAGEFALSTAIPLSYLRVGVAACVGAECSAKLGGRECGVCVVRLAGDMRGGVGDSLRCLGPESAPFAFPNLIFNLGIDFCSGGELPSDRLFPGRSDADDDL